MIRRQTASILVFVALIACAGMSGCPNQDGLDDPMMPGDMNPNPDPNPNDNGNSNSTPPPPNGNGNGNGNTNDNGNVNDNSPPPPPPRDPPEWNPAFITDNNTPMDTTDDIGALSSVWGSGPNDVFVVGGKGFPPAAKIYHYNGSTWKEMGTPPNTLGMVWVFGFSPTDVYAVGLGGHMLHYDGMSWTRIDAHTGFDLWGIWGVSPTDIWIVGKGPTSAVNPNPDPTLMHFDPTQPVASQFTPYPLPMTENDRLARDLFKVWGIGAKLFAVGEKGLIIEYDGTAWKQVPAGANADDDFVSLWGTSTSNIVAVGGRSAYRLSVYAGTGWTTYKPSNPLGQPALNAVFMDESDLAIIGGVNGDDTGYVGRFDPTMTTPVAETAADATQAIHAIWGDGMGSYYAVGGNFSFPFSDGMCLVRTYGPPGFSPAVPSSP